MDGVDAQIILLMLAILFSKNFKKENTVENLTCLVKWGGFFHLEERLLFAILNNLRGSKEINAIFLL